MEKPTSASDQQMSDIPYGMACVDIQPAVTLNLRHVKSGGPASLAVRAFTGSRFCVPFVEDLSIQLVRPGWPPRPIETVDVMELKPPYLVSKDTGSTIRPLSKPQFLENKVR